jgi:predicted RNA-binding Zn ribbon-like protein
MSGTPKATIGAAAAVTSPAGTLFDLAGGHPALDLVNSLDNRFRADGPNEMLASYPDLLRFATESGLLQLQQLHALGEVAGSEAAIEALHAVRELREATAGVCYALVEKKTPPPGDIRTLERCFLAADQHRELCWRSSLHDPKGRANITWQWRRAEPNPSLPIWMLSQAVAELLLSDRVTQIKTCDVETCRWLFLDTSKNHTRRWCNMKVCGNRMKARRFQARQN